MKILGFTDLRRRELEQPLEAVAAEETIIAVDPELSFFQRMVVQIRDGLWETESSPDLILLYNGSGILGIIAVFFSWYYSAPVIIRVNGDIFRQHREKVVEYRHRGEYLKMVLYASQLGVTRMTFGRASGFLVVSQELREIVQAKTGCPESRIAVVHNPVPDVETDSEETLPVRTGPHHECIVLTVTNLNFRGKFEGAKDIIDSIAPRLPENSEYIIAGDGMYQQQLETYIETTVDFATRERIHTPGYIEDVDPLYAAADIFVYVSYLDGYPNVVLEAQAAGLPVVANSAHGMVEQIVDGRTGILVDPDQKSAIDSAVLSLIADRSRRRELGAAARRQVHQHNAPERIGREMMTAIGEIVENTGTPVGGQQSQ